MFAHASFLGRFSTGSLRSVNCVLLDVFESDQVSRGTIVRTQSMPPVRTPVVHDTVESA